jgi:hypothetical protein
MKYIHHVSSSIKGGCNVTLGPRTVLYGANGSGKTTIVQAIELATSGFVSDMEGRERVKQNKALSRLFPDGKPMFAEAVLRDTDTPAGSQGADTSFMWKMEAGPKGGFKTPEHEAPFVVRFPVQELIDTLGGDAKTVGAWLEKRVIDTLSVEDVLSLLPPAIRDDAGKFIKRKGQTDLLALAKAAAAEGRNLKSQATRSEKTIGRMTEGIDPPLTAAKLSALEEEYAELSSQKSGITQEQYDAFANGVARLRQAVAKAKEAIPGEVVVPDHVSNTLQKVAQAKHLIKQHVDIFGVDVCMVCGNPGEEATISKQVDLMNSIEDTYAEAVHAAGVRARAVQTFEQVSAELKRKEEYLAGLEVSSGHPEREARELLARISADKANRKAWENADAARKEVDQLRATADKLSLVAKELEKAGAKQIAKKKTEFEDSVSSFLPSDEKLGVDLAASRLGLMRNGQLHSALSGAEESRVLLALAASAQLGSTPCVLIPKDRGWDRDTLTSVMEALSESSVQIVLMSTVQPDPVEGWTLLEM